MNLQKYHGMGSESTLEDTFFIETRFLNRKGPILFYKQLILWGLKKGRLMVVTGITKSSLGHFQIITKTP